MNYSLNQYFHEKSLKSASDSFTKGVEVVFDELNLSLEKKLMNYSTIEGLVCYNKYKKSIDCDKTRISFRSYFNEESLVNKVINIIYLDKPLVFENLRIVGVFDRLSSINGFPFFANLFINTNYSIDSEDFLIIGMHEASHLFNLWHCENDELCIMKEKNASYAKYLKYYEKENKIPFCNTHLLNFNKFKC